LRSFTQLRRFIVSYEDDTKLGEISRFLQLDIGVVQKALIKI